MGKKFKWDMFVTSFIPLWVSIVVIDIWTTFESMFSSWDHEISYWDNLFATAIDNLLPIITIFILLVFVISSMRNIKKFLNARSKEPNKPSGTIKSARRANKLTSEFLLAYILPMIAFDFSEIKSVVLFIVYFSVLAFLCIRNNNVYTNIYLEFLRHKMYDCDIECQGLSDKHIYKDSLIISPVDLTLEIGNKMPYWDFENYIYIILPIREG